MVEAGWGSGPGAVRTGSSRVIWGFAVGFVLLSVLAFVVVRTAGDSAERERADAAAAAWAERARQRAPFESAVIAMAEAPGVRYEDGTFSVRLTTFGDYTGSITIRGGVYPVLRSQGTVSAELPPSLVNTLQPSATETKPTWVRIGPAVAGLLGVSLDDVPDDPSDLAQQTLDRLNDAGTVFEDTTTTPTATSSPEVPTSVPYLTATTPTGPVEVTATAPYELLAVPPAAEPDVPAGTDPADDGEDTGQVAWVEPGNAVPVFDPGSTATLEQLSAEKARDAYDQMVKQTRAAAKTVDPGIKLDLSQQAKIKCSEVICSVSAKVSTSARLSGDGTEDSEITGGTVKVALTADIEVNGTAGAGRCTDTVSMKLDKTKTLRCSTSSASGAIRRALSRARAEAEAKSRALNGARVPYTVPYGGIVEVRAVARVDVRTLVRALQNRQDLLDDLVEPAVDTDETASDDTATSEETAPQTSSSGQGRPVPQPTTTDDERISCQDLQPAGATAHGTGWKNFVIGANRRTDVGEACFESPVVAGHPTAPDGSPAGWAQAQAIAVKVLPHAKGYGLARCHLVPAVLGGPNEASSGNLVACWQSTVNINSRQPIVKQSMRPFENSANTWIRDPANANMLTVYEVTPVYRNAASTIPVRFSMRYRSWDRDTHQLTHIRWTSIPNVYLDKAGKAYSLAN